MAEVQHVFGTQIDGYTYHARRAVYAVIPDSDGRVAAVRYRGNLFLPGGGIAAGESPEQALGREEGDDPIVVLKRDGVQDDGFSVVGQAHGSGSMPQFLLEVNPFSC